MLLSLFMLDGGAKTALTFASQGRAMYRNAPLGKMFLFFHEVHQFLPFRKGDRSKQQ